MLPSLRLTPTLASLGVTLSLLIAVTSWSNASHHARKTNNGGTATTGNFFWDADIFNLPPDVPFPGADWLQRIATADTHFVWNNTAYSSAYAAIVPDALRMPCRNFNAYINSFFIGPKLAGWILWHIGNLDVAHYVLCYVRNFVAAMLVYYGTAGLFHYFCYVHSSSWTIFEQAGRQRPRAATIWNQIALAQQSLIIYTLLPVVDEYLVENNYTRMYYTVQAMGGPGWYAVSMISYFAAVEVGIYWMHRTLHTNKTLYKHIHLLHHQYNKAETLTPWASIAFHPLDGILQASPYVVCMLFLPCHYLTHFGLLFFTAIWATYIHDAMDWNIDPIMGSKYHTVHHTHYIYNYGQVFQFCDWYWGTLRVPDGPTGVGGTSKRAKKVA